MKPNLDKIIQDNLDKAKFQSKVQPSLPKNTGWLDQYVGGGTYISGKALATQFGQYSEGGEKNTYVPPIMPDLRHPGGSDIQNIGFQKPIEPLMGSTVPNNPDIIRKIEKEKVAKELALRKQASQVMKQKGNTSFTFPNGEHKPYKDMNFREKSYVEGLALDQDTRLFPNAESSIFDEYINPLHMVGSMGKGLAQAPYVAKQTNSYIPYVTGIGTPLLAGRMMGSGSMNPLSSKMWTNEISNKEFANILAGGIPKIIKNLPRGTMNLVDRNFSDIGKNLQKIEKEGLAEGLSSHEIAKKQLEQVGITSNQRKAYTPFLSNFSEKYVFPYGYEGMNGKNKLQQIINNIRNGGIKFNKTDYKFARTEISPERLDAWRLYLGKPQKNNTFRIAETSPINHPSYSSEQLANMDIYSINSDFAKIGIEPYIEIEPYTAYPELMSPLMIENNMNLLRKKINIDKGNEIMGGFNKRLNKHGLEYNDIWDLQPSITPKKYLPNLLKNTLGESSLFTKMLPNGVEVPRSFKININSFLGKPFMSHEVLPYTSDDFTKKMTNLIDDQINKLKESPYDMTPKIQKMEAYKEELKNYPKHKYGGDISIPNLNNKWLNNYIKNK